MIEEQKITDAFIGHQQELDIFNQWLASTDSTKPWILFFHDALSDPEKKGGVGKTWLLRRCAVAAHRQRPDIAIVMVDFFNATDRDGVTVAQRIVESLKLVYPTWTPLAFQESLDAYLASVNQQEPYINATEVTDRGSLRIDNNDLLAPLYDAFVRDLESLDSKLADQQTHLLVLFDTYELIEQNPVIAVLNAAHVFPHTYNFTHIAAVVAGRNAPDWQHRNWEGREREVRCVPVHPFNIDEMVQFINNNGTFANVHSSLSTEQAQALYARTEGRPILVGLVTDMLNHRIMHLDELIATPPKEFERFLVTHINHIEEPLNWAILFMAHTYHRFNPALLDWILTHLTADKKFILDVDTQILVERLLELSFVRRASTGDNITLHDEMRRLVNTYNWSAQEIFPEQYRADISRIVVAYYEKELASPLSKQLQQIYTIEMIYHKLFVDSNDGFSFASQCFNEALGFWQSAYARAIFQELQKFSATFSEEQRWRMLHGEASLLRREENNIRALAIYQQLEEQADEHFWAQRRADIQFEKGKCYQQISAFDKAIACFRDSYELEMQQQHYSRAAFILNTLGLISRKLGKMSEAEKYCNESMALNKQIKNRRNYANALNTMGNLYRLQGKMDEALQYITVALQIRRELYSKGLTSEVGIGQCLSSTGLVYLKMGDFTLAQQYAEAAFNVYERNKYLTGIAAIYNRFGQIDIGRMQLTQALEWFKRGYRASLGISAEEEINSLNKQGRVLILLDQVEKALPFFEQAIRRAQEVEDVYQRLESLIDLADAQYKRANTQAMRRNLELAEQAANVFGYHDLSGFIEKMYGEECYRLHQYQLAFQHFASYCYHTARFNSLEYDAAIRYTIDKLLELSTDRIATVREELQTYWTTFELEDSVSSLLIKSLKRTDLLLDI